MGRPRRPRVRGTFFGPLGRKRLGAYLMKISQGPESVHDTRLSPPTKKPPAPKEPGPPAPSLEGTVPVTWEGEGAQAPASPAEPIPVMLPRGDAGPQPPAGKPITGADLASELEQSGPAPAYDYRGETVEDSQAVSEFLDAYLEDNINDLDLDPQAYDDRGDFVRNVVDQILAAGEREKMTEMEQTQLEIEARGWANTQWDKYHPEDAGKETTGYELVEDNPEWREEWTPEKGRRDSYEDEEQDRQRETEGRRGDVRESLEEADDQLRLSAEAEGGLPTTSDIRAWLARYFASGLFGEGGELDVAGYTGSLHDFVRDTVYYIDNALLATRVDLNEDKTQQLYTMTRMYAAGEWDQMISTFEGDTPLGEANRELRVAYESEDPELLSNALHEWVAQYFAADGVLSPSYFKRYEDYLSSVWDSLRRILRYDVSKEDQRRFDEQVGSLAREHWEEWQNHLAGKKGTDKEPEGGRPPAEEPRGPKAALRDVWLPDGRNAYDAMTPEQRREAFGFTSYGDMMNYVDSLFPKHEFGPWERTSYAKRKKDEASGPDDDEAEQAAIDELSASSWFQDVSERIPNADPEEYASRREFINYVVEWVEDRAIKNDLTGGERDHVSRLATEWAKRVWNEKMGG